MTDNSAKSSNERDVLDTLSADYTKLRLALLELVRLKDLKTDAEAINTSGDWGAVRRQRAMLAEHDAKKGEAWDAARRALSGDSSAPEVVEVQWPRCTGCATQLARTSVGLYKCPACSPDETSAPRTPQRYRVQQDKGEYALKGCDDGDLVDWSAYEELLRRVGSAVETPREPTASEAASFDTTLARSPRRVAEKAGDHCPTGDYPCVAGSKTTDRMVKGNCIYCGRPVVNGKGDGT